MSDMCAHAHIASSLSTQAYGACTCSLIQASMPVDLEVAPLGVDQLVAQALQRAAQAVGAVGGGVAEPDRRRLAREHDQVAADSPLLDMPIRQEL